MVAGGNSSLATCASSSGYKPRIAPVGTPGGGGGTIDFGGGGTERRLLFELESAADLEPAADLLAIRPISSLLMTGFGGKCFGGAPLLFPTVGLSILGW